VEEDKLPKYQKRRKKERDWKGLKKTPKGIKNTRLLEALSCFAVKRKSFQKGHVPRV